MAKNKNKKISKRSIKKLIEFLEFEFKDKKTINKDGNKQ